MSRWLKALIVVSICAAIPSFGWAGNVNFVLGSRSFDEDEWAPVEDQDVFGVNVDFGGEDWPINLVIGAFTSSDDESIFGVGVELESTELSFGVMKIWDQFTSARPFLSGGLSFINGDLSASVGPFTASDDDSSAAIFIDGGIFWRIGERFNIGIEGRFVTGSDIEIAGLDTDVDYTQGGLILGWGW